MKTFRTSLLVLLMSLTIPAVLHAQSGCSDSPEAPTDVLLLVGSVGMFYGSSVVMTVLRRSKGK